MEKNVMATPKKAAKKTAKAKKSREPKDLPGQFTLHLDPTQKTVFCDGINFAPKQDGNMILLHCLSTLPAGSFEQARIVVTKDHAKRIVLALSKMLQFYPKKVDIDNYSFSPNTSPKTAK